MVKGKYNKLTFEVLKELGMSPNVLGYKYVAYIIQQCLDGKMDIYGSVTREIYPDTAKVFNTTPSRVEKAIRHSIECAFDTMPVNIIEKYFGNVISQEKDKVMNKQFITLVAQHIKLHL